MSEYIEREAAISSLDELEKTSHHNSVLWPDHVEECREALRSIPAADVVTRDCYERILWENDIMRQQLADIGKAFAEKMDDVRPVVRGKWTRIDYEPYGHDYKCSACGWKNDMPTHFCPNCGADMRGTDQKEE